MVVSEQIFQRVRQTRLESLIMLENGQGEVLELVALEDSRIPDLPISQLLLPGAILTTLIRQQEIIPRGNHRVRAGDTVIMLLTSSARSAVERLFQRRIL